MFITRANRRDVGDLEEFFTNENWPDPVLDQGVAFIARSGPIIGNVRLIEFETNQLVVEDVVVAEARRGEGIGRQLVQAAMNSRGGTLYLCCHPETKAFYEKFDFSEVPFDELPEAIRNYFEEHGDAPEQLEEGHVHHFMTAR